MSIWKLRVLNPRLKTRFYQQSTAISHKMKTDRDREIKQNKAEIRTVPLKLEKPKVSCTFLICCVHVLRKGIRWC